MDPTLIGKNAKRIRYGQDMTQAEVAEGAGISTATYSKVESGRSLPRLDTLYRIAGSLQVGVHELLAPVRELSQVRFRAKKKLKKRDNILARTASWLDDFNYLLDSQGARAEYTLKKVPDSISTKSGIDRSIEAARTVRIAMDLGESEPIHDIAGLLASHGIKLLACPLKSDAFFGMSVGERDGGPAVVVNVWDRIPVERWIFSAAHELGHLVLHLDAFDAGISAEDKTQEDEANKFASYFLMPQKGFDREWAETRGLDLWDRILKIKRIYRVSYKTVLMRLIELGYTDTHIWKKTNIFLKQRYRKPRIPKNYEPKPLADDDFVIDWLDRLVREAVESENISVGRAAEILGLSLDDMRERVNVWVEDSGAAHT